MHNSDYLPLYTLFKKGTLQEIPYGTFNLRNSSLVPLRDSL